MIASRLEGAARLILAEFERTELPKLLQTASSLSANRANISEPQWLNQVDQVHDGARNALTTDAIKGIPADMKSLLEKSGYASVLPSRIAQVILSGLNADKNATVTSSEFGSVKAFLDQFIHDLTILVAVYKRLNLEAVNIPEGLVSLDVLIPREAFGNDASAYISISKRFVSIMSYFIEATTGRPGNPVLVYTSTSDPVTGYALFILTAGSFLTFYSQILDVAKKQIEFFAFIKTFKSTPFKVKTEESLEDQVAQLVKDEIEKSVASSMATADLQVDDRRRAEIRVALTKDARAIVNSVANGARVTVTIESLPAFDKLAANEGQEKGVELQKLLKHNQAQGMLLDQQRKALGEPIPLNIEAPEDPEVIKLIEGPSSR